MLLDAVEGLNRGVGLRFAFLLTLVTSIAPALFPQSASSLSAAGFVAQAQLAFAERRYADCLEIALAGSDIDGRNSDLHYLAGKAWLALDDNAKKALAEVSSAISSGQFHAIESGEAFLFKAELLIRIRRYGDALSILPSASSALDARYALARARALYGLGLPEKAEAAIQAGSKGHPEDSRFASLFFERELGSVRERTRNLAGFFLRRMNNLALSDPELPLLALPYFESESARRDVITEYRALHKGGATLAALEFGVESPQDAVAEFFSGSGSILFSDLHRLDDLLGPVEARALLDPKLRIFSGQLRFDRDGDGFIDSTASYESGQLISWSSDSEQDGEMDLQVQFRFGEPVSAKLSREGGDLRIEWHDFPAVGRLSWADAAPSPMVGAQPLDRGEKSAVRTYDIVPEQMTWAPFSLSYLPSRAGDFIVPSPTAYRVPTEVEALASAFDLKTSSGETDTIVKFAQGIPILREKRIGERLIARLEYKQGIPWREFSDMDRDGRFETLSTMDSSGENIAVVQMDYDGDGYFEYSEEMKAPFTRTWDFNSDGLPDSMQISLADGSIERRFSSHFNGIFDLILHASVDGEILSITRDGKKLALLPDLNPILRWIGPKPFDLEDRLPTKEGVYVERGLKYRLIQAGSRFIAEIIP